MLRSMTGFGRGEFAEDGKKFIVEIKTVNHRFTDIFIKYPKSISFVEERVREDITNRLSRGKVDVVITFEDNSEGNLHAVTDVNLADSYYEALNQLKDRYNLNEDIGISVFTRIPDVIKIEKCEEDHEIIWSILKKALHIALDNLISMRETEGANLKADLLQKLDKISIEIDIISQRSSLVVLEYKEKLEARISELLDGTELDPQRIAMEVTVFADKCSIDEELTRFKSHITQFKDTLDTDVAVGRKLDFLVQEMNREANTIGSKANDLTIINAVIDIKFEIEKIREQIQNVE